MRNIGFRKNTLNLRKLITTRKSYTLIEVLVVAAIVGIISAGVISILDIGNRCWNQEMALVGLQQEIRLAMEGMSREIRQGENILYVDEFGEDKALGDKEENIHFRIFSALDGKKVFIARIKYSLEGTKVVRNLFKINGQESVSDWSSVDWENVDWVNVATQVLSSNISFLNFSRSGDIIEIQLQAKKNAINRELRFPLREAPDDGVDKFLKSKVRLRNE